MRPRAVPNHSPAYPNAPTSPRHKCRIDFLVNVGPRRMNSLVNIFRRLQVKQANICRRGPTLRRKAASVPDPRANSANESHVASPRSDSSGADCRIPRGVAMLIDILAREALKDVLAAHRKLQRTATRGKRRLNLENPTRRQSRVPAL
jgi:hypothetical protein